MSLDLSDDIKPDPLSKADDIKPDPLTFVVKGR